MWHGGKRWEGSPEIRPARQGKYECGPGLYLTTSYLRARKYAAGGKVTTRVTLADGVRWLEQATLPLRELLDYVQTAPRVSNRKKLESDLIRYYADAAQSLDESCAVSRLVNLLINAESLSGKAGVHFANWLVSKGIDASLHSPMAGEQWVVVFNPDIICQHRVVPASRVGLENYELPRIDLPKA